MVAFSPESMESREAGDYARNWDALGALIASGKSFSGRERNAAFLNLRSPDIAFACASGALNLDQIDDSRAIIPADWDNDGDLDLWYSNRTSPRLRFLRNDLAAGGHWLSLSLEGKSANRDAVGARANLTLRAADGSERTLWRRVKAGDGFLSQAPKSLHFAFLPDETITRLTIHWPAPGPPEQVVTNIAADAAWKIVENGAATRLDRSVITLPATPPSLPAEPSPIRAPLIQRIPLGAVPYWDSTGKPASLEGPMSQPLLVLLWGSWCPRCAAEMKELSRRASELKPLRLLALAVDTATPGAGRDEVETVRRTLADRAWPFEVGFATQATVSALARAEARALYPERALELPSAYLIAPDGKLSVIYHGPVDPGQLTKDAGFAQSPPASPEAVVFPFPGRSARALIPGAPLAQAQALREAGAFDDARDLLRQSLEAVSKENHPARLAILRRLADLEDAAGKPEAAATVWSEALTLAPRDASLHLAATASLWRAGRSNDAEAAFKQAATLARDPAAFQNALGKVWQALGEHSRALAAFTDALAGKPDSAETTFNLAVASQFTGRIAEAIRHYEAALRLDPTLLDARSNLAWVLATTKDAGHRNPQRALALATEVNTATTGQSPAVLDTLAAAQAATGDFAAAVDQATRALTLARASGETTLATEIERRLSRYRDRQPWEE